LSSGLKPWFITIWLRCWFTTCRWRFRILHEYREIKSGVEHIIQMIMSTFQNSEAKDMQKNNFGTHGCEMWSLTLKEHKLLAAESRAFRKIFRPRKDEMSITGFYSDELLDIYKSFSIVIVVIARCLWRKRWGMNRVLMGKSAGKRPLKNSEIEG
jgi:hypothetical protein